MAFLYIVFFFNYPATTDIYTYLHTLSLHDALPISEATQPRSSAPRVGCDPIPYLGCFLRVALGQRDPDAGILEPCKAAALDKRPAVRPDIRAPEQRQCPSGLTLAARSEEHTSELQSLMRTSYAVFCLKKTKK